MSATQGTCPTQGTPTGGQCSRGSPQAAGTSLPDQPSRATIRLTVFSFVPRCQGSAGRRSRSARSVAAAIWAWLGHLAALVPGQGPSQLLGQLAISATHGVVHGERRRGRSGRCSSWHNPVLRSTRVPIADLPCLAEDEIAFRKTEPWPGKVGCGLDRLA